MKKNKKQRFISDKISELRAEGKNQQQSIAIALSMAENMLKEGGDVELPKYQGQFGSSTVGDMPSRFMFNSDKAYQDYLKSNNIITSKTSDNQLKIGQLPAPNFGTPSKTHSNYDTSKSLNPAMTPSTSYNPGSFNFTESVVPQQNRQASIGQLDLNNTLFTEPATQMPNATGSTTGSTTASTTTTAEPAITPQLKPEVTSALKGTAPEATDYISQIQKANETVRQDSQLSDENTTAQLQRQTPPIQFANPYGGVDLNAASALFGQSLQQGDTAMGIASGAKLGLGLARNFMSGYAAGKDRNRVLNDYSSNMRNAMTGAETPVQFQEGGTANEQDQLLQQIAMMLQQGASPEQIIQELINAGIPEQEAMQAIQMVMQQYQAQQQEQVPQEQQMMQEGGVATQPEVPVEMANAEIEDGEYVQDGEGVKYAEGAKHSEGGIPTQLENGARVLSDYKKVGKDLSKQFSEQLGFEVKASDTFATVLDKFNRKEGFDKKVKHLDKYSDKLEKQEKTVKHDATLALNKQILMEEAQEDTQKLQELVKQQEGLFNMLFEAQEASKGIETEGNFMQQGGTVNDLMAKYNISAEEAMKLVPSFQGVEGSSTYNVPEAAAIEESIVPFDPELIGGVRRLENVYEKPQYGKQSEVGTGYFGDTVTFNSMDVQKNIKRLHPELYDKYFKQGKIMPEDVAGFQRDINKKYDDLKEDYKKQLGENSDEYKKIEAQIESDKFTQADDVKSFDAKFGDYTSTRPSYQIPVLPLDVFKQIQSEGINTAYELKNKRPDLYEKFVASKDLKSDFTLGANLNKPGEIGRASSFTVEETPMEIPTTPVVDVAQDKNRMAFLNLPDQTPMLPWAMQAPAMLRQTIYAPRWNEISPEQQLTDIQRGRVATAEQMSFLPDSQQASSLFALDANAMAAQNKVRSETERYNQMARERTEAAEADQKTRQSAADVVAAQTYQQQLGNELESNEADWRGFYNRLQGNQMNNYLTTNEYNRSNAFNPNVQFTGQGYEVINEPTYSVDSAKIPMTQEPTKKKKSTKRFGK